jgi:hypothetical protein
VVEKEDNSGQAVLRGPLVGGGTTPGERRPLASGTRNGCGNIGRAGVALRGEAPRAGEGHGGQVSCLRRGAPAL